MMTMNLGGSAMLDCSKITTLVNTEATMVLPVYFPPPMFYSLNTAINLAAILTLPEAHKWYYNCMIQLAFHKNWECNCADHPLDIFPANLIRIGRHGGIVYT